MANYSNIRNKIISDIKPNNNQEITGQIMQDTLLQMVSLLQDGGYLFKGGATTTTNPIVGDSNVFYLASVKGTYANFGGLQVNDNELAALVYNGSWSKISIDNQIAHLKDIWNVEYLPVFFLRVEFSNDTIAKISIDDVITTDFEAIIDDFINKTAFIFAYNSVNGSSEVNEFLSPVSVRKTEAGDSVEFIFDGINRNRYRVVVNYKDLSIQNQARQLIFLPNVSTLQDGLMSKEDKEKLDTLYTDFTDLTPEVVTMDDYEDDDSPTMGIIVHDRSGGTTKKVKNSGVLLNDLLRKDQFPVATSSKIGGIKSGGGFITVDTDGIVKVNRSQTADNSENDENGDNIVYTYAKKADLPGIATSTVAGIIKGGGDIAVGNDGSVTVNNSAFAMQANLANSALRDGTGAQIDTTYLRYSRASAHGRYYKFLTLERGPEKGIIRFGIESPLMGYADYMVNWTYDTNTEKGMNLYCLFSTNAQMYNRVKLVRTGNDTFDVYFESNAGNDYPAFVFMGEGGTTESNCITSYIVSTVSAIPENIYKESAGTSAYFHNDVYVLRDYAKGDPILKFISPGHIEKWIRLNRTNNHLEIVDSNGSLTELYASSFVGDLKGTADEATTATYAQNATYDNAGNKIVDTYAKKTELPKIATSTVAGIIKGGGDIAVAADGSVTVNNAGVAQMAMQDSSGRVIVNTYVPKTQVATSSAAGLVKSGNDISVASDGTVTVTSATTVDNVPAATSSKIGGVKSGGDILVSSTGEVTVNNAASAEEAVHATRADNATNVTNVPVATTSKIGGIKAGANITVDSNGGVRITYAEVAGSASTADEAASLSFSNSDDAINIDNYPQADYGVIPIWLNTAEADGYPPGREGLVFQAKYRSEQGSSGTEYVDCLTQFYVGNEGVRHRTIVDYDEATKFENTPWSKINDDCYFNLGTATVASSTSSSAGVTFTGSSAFSSIRTLLDGLSLATMSNAMPNIFLGFSLDTGNGITHYIRTNVSSISRLSNGNYALFAMYQNPLFGDENYVNVLRISITPSSYSCQTLKSL